MIGVLIRVSYNAAGLSVELDPAFEADTLRFSLEISASLSEPLSPGGDLSVPLKLATPVLVRESPKAPLKYTIPHAELETSLKGIQAGIFGLSLTLSETLAGEDLYQDFVEEVYLIPDLGVSLATVEDPDPGWYADLLVQSELFDGSNRDPLIRIVAQVIDPKTAVSVGNERLLAISRESLTWEPNSSSYRIKTKALANALEAVPRGLDQVVQLLIYTDIDNSSSLGRLESKTSIELPPPTVVISPDALAIREGSTATFVLSATGLPVGTMINYKVSGEGVDSGDFINASFSGSLRLGPDGKATLELRTTEDKKSEGEEAVEIAIVGAEITASLGLLDPETDLGAGENDPIADTPSDPPGSSRVVQVGGGQTVNGESGNDRFIIGRLGNVIDGGNGIDTAVYDLPRSSATVEASGASGASLKVTHSGTTDTLENVERIVFRDFALAFDLKENSAVIDVVKILATVFGPNSVRNPEYAGIGIHFLDQGLYDTPGLMQLALGAALGNQISDPASVVRLLYENVTGVKPTNEQAAPFIEQLKDGSHTPESLALMAADINASATQNIDFAGILQHGLQYLPVL